MGITRMFVIDVMGCFHFFVTFVRPCYPSKGEYSSGWASYKTIYCCIVGFNSDRLIGIQSKINLDLMTYWFTTVYSILPVVYRSNYLINGVIELDSTVHSLPLNSWRINELSHINSWNIRSKCTLHYTSLALISSLVVICKWIIY